MKAILPFYQRLSVARIDCQQHSYALTDQIEEYIQKLDLDAQVSPSIIKKMIIDFLGKPPFEFEFCTGWREFMTFAKILDEGYSVFPLTLFNPTENERYLNNLMLLDKHMLKKGISEKRFRSMNTIDIAMLLAEADAAKVILCNYVTDLKDKAETAGNVQNAPDEAHDEHEGEDAPEPGNSTDDDDLIF
ncbi:TPA: hypothetical protein NID02_001611 [Pseudomonas aeruginosa]|nr:hypothetical protein [Pseudomonas aeruginosa]